MVINEPILLNSTGLDILAQLKKRTAYMKLIAQSKLPNEYKDISLIARMIRSGTVEQNKKLFPIGDQITVPWKDLDDPQHNTDETAWQIPFDIVHHDMVELKDGTKIPGMYIMAHTYISGKMCFAHPQALMVFPEGLSAGTYSITFPDGYSYGGLPKGYTCHFTLTMPIPQNGMISGLRKLVYGTNLDDSEIYSWSSATDSSYLEKTTVMTGAEGISLGSLFSELDEPESNINRISNAVIGSNEWAKSALRQYMNSSGHNWYTPPTKFDIRPDQYARHGFLSGLDPAFIDALLCPKTYTFGPHNEVVTTYDKMFIPSWTEIYGDSKDTLDPEGDPIFEYWRKRAGGGGRFSWFEDRPELAIQQATDFEVNCSSVVLRSYYSSWNCLVTIGNKKEVNGKYTSGYLANGHDYVSHHEFFGFAPVCVLG